MCVCVCVRPPQACAKHGVAAGTFCFGAAKAAEQARKGFVHVAFDIDTNILMASAAASLAQLRSLQQQ